MWTIISRLEIAHAYAHHLCPSGAFTTDSD